MTAENVRVALRKVENAKKAASTAEKKFSEANAVLQKAHAELLVATQAYRGEGDSAPAEAAEGTEAAE